MIYKQLGNTNVSIPAIGQGTAGFRRYPKEADRQANALRLGIEMRMTLIDTAEQYGGGYSEEIVARAVKGIREKAFIATKVSPENLTYNGVLKAAEGSLRRLETDYIDLYQIHWPNPAIPLEETLKAMERLVKEGKVRFIGVCNFSLRQLRQAMEITDIVSIQLEYNLFDHTADNLPQVLGKPITLIGHTPLDHGRISGGDKELEALKQIAAKYHQTVAQLTLNWLVSHRGVVVIPKAASYEHVKENAEAAIGLLPEDFIAIVELFPSRVIYMEPYKIRIGEKRKDYKTKEEALENPWNAYPSPSVLAQRLRDGEPLKPVRITPASDNTYDLVEGGTRYWAHIIAYGGAVLIPAMIRR